MIVKVGIDIVEVQRISRAATNPRFTERILTNRERTDGMTPVRLAGRWAAKEAIAKAVSIQLSWHDVEIFHSDDGSPYAEIRSGVLAENERIHISISHERGHAVGLAVYERL